MTYPYAPQPTVDREAVRTHFRTALRHRTLTALWTAVADIPVLLAELDRTLRLLTDARIEAANVLAAARASLAAADEGETDALGYVRDEVMARTPQHAASDAQDVSGGAE